MTDALGAAPLAAPRSEDASVLLRCIVPSKASCAKGTAAAACHRHALAGAPTRSRATVGALSDSGLIEAVAYALVRSVDLEAPRRETERGYCPQPRTGPASVPSDLAGRTRSRKFVCAAHPAYGASTDAIERRRTEPDGGQAARSDQYGQDLSDRSAGEAEHAHGVVLENQRPDVVLDVQLVEVGAPAVRGDDREVRAEQDLALEQRVGRPDQLRREVLGRP